MINSSKVPKERGINRVTTLRSSIIFPSFSTAPCHKKEKEKERKGKEKEIKAKC